MLNKNKRKLNKSGSEQISPEDKKTRSIKDQLLTLTMASKYPSSSGASAMDSPLHQQTVNITPAQWKELMIKIENISKVTDEIKDIQLTIKDIQTGLDIGKCKNKDINKVVNSIETNTENWRKECCKWKKHKTS